MEQVIWFVNVDYNLSKETMMKIERTDNQIVE